VLLCLALKISPAACWRFRFGLASLSEVSVYQPGATLNTLNDTTHLRSSRERCQTLADKSLGELQTGTPTENTSRGN
jgi:hypothetical protein